MRLAPFALVLSAGLVALAAGCGGSSDGEFREYGEIEGQPTRARAAAGPAGKRSTDPAPATAAADPDRQPGADRDPISMPRPAVAESPNRPAGSGSVVQTAAVSTNAKRQPGGLPAAPAAPREIKLLVPSATFQPAGPEGAVRISYDDLDLLKVLNMEPVPVNCVDYFPDWLKSLDGRRVRVRGFMYPTFQDTGLEGFVLARDNDICCFGRDPKRYDLIDVFMREGVTTDYIQGRPFDVVGVFHIEPDAYQGQLDRLYIIDDAVVIKP